MLVDTSVLARTLQFHHPLYAIVDQAVERLLDQGHELQIVTQNLVELWVVATRPVEQNGLGITPIVAAGELARMKNMFKFLPDSAAVYPIWEGLVIQYNVSGKPAHDARLVAAMLANSIRSILTFDASGFTRYAGIEVVHPADVVLPRLDS